MFDDVADGVLALNARKFSDGIGDVWYFTPDTLEWESVEIKYSEFIYWIIMGNTDEFYCTLRRKQMEDNIIGEFELHKKWVETIGKEGKKLCLEEVDFRNFDLSDKLLEQANIVECIFDNLNLKDMDFHASLLCSSTYKNTNLDDCDFYRSNLSYTDFSNANLNRVRFSKSDCWEAIFRNADLIDCNLINVYFYLTDFSNARLDNVDISVATFQETILNGVTLKNIKGIEEAHFKSINIGTLEKPTLLKLEEAKEWIIANCL